jgi:hypothetical protein
MAAHRMSRLQKRLLIWLAAAPHQTQGVTARRHQALGRALAAEQGHLRHRLRSLAARGRLVIGRSPGSQAQDLRHMTKGSKWAARSIGGWE